MKRVQKTGSMLYLPLNQRAIRYLPPRTNDQDNVFRLPKTMNAVELYIKIWCEFAGINKPVTFHTSRHSFAVNILARGGDIFTLSKLLGHKNVTTIQIYADILGKNKKATIDLLDE